jgi:hypothetical protein
VSKLENKVEKFLKLEFPNFLVRKNYYVSFNNSKLLFDFVIPELKIAIEVQGEQHYTFNTMFHKDRTSLVKQQYRDTLKTQWCDENDYKLLEIHFSKLETLTKEELRNLIILAL